MAGLDLMPIRAGWGTHTTLSLSLSLTPDCTVSFDMNNYAVEEGGSVNVTVNITAPGRSIENVVTVTLTSSDDGAGKCVCWIHTYITILSLSHSLPPSGW